jgi:hypothetical protein
LGVEPDPIPHVYSNVRESHDNRRDLVCRFVEGESRSLRLLQRSKAIPGSALKASRFWAAEVVDQITRAQRSREPQKPCCVLQLVTGEGISREEQRPFLRFGRVADRGVILSMVTKATSRPEGRPRLMRNSGGQARDRSPLTCSTILPGKIEAAAGRGWRGKASAAPLYRVQLFSKCNTQSETASPLPMLACTRPSIMKVGDTWIPFWRAYLQCHLTSRSRSGIAKASETLAPL